NVGEGSRRSGAESVDVKTKIRASDAWGAGAIASGLGKGDALKMKLNAALKAQGLRECAGVSAPNATPSSTALTASTTATLSIIAVSASGFALIGLAAIVMLLLRQRANAAAASASAGGTRTHVPADTASSGEARAEPAAPSAPRLSEPPVTVRGVVIGLDASGQVGLNDVIVEHQEERGE
ncbi:MAG: hypothetical protein ACPIOQ_85370, partial [Promethearchaeia archaeon]